MEHEGFYLPIWGNYLDTLGGLSERKLGRLFSAMMHYYFDGIVPELDEVLTGYWVFLRRDMDYAQNNYRAKVESGRKGGLRSAEARKKAKEQLAGEADPKPASSKSTKKKQSQPKASNPEESQQITRTESRTESRSETKSRIKEEHSSPAASGEAGISCEEKSYGEYGWVKLTDAQYRRLQAKLGIPDLEDCIRYVDRSAQSTGNRNHWKDWYLVILRCFEAGWHRPRAPIQQASTFKWASEELGAAELEAIQQTLRMEFPDLPPLVEERD